jgi:hypothetical protein
MRSGTIKAIIIAIGLMGCAEDELCEDAQPGTYHITVSDMGGNCDAAFVEGLILDIQGNGVTTFSSPQTCGEFSDTLVSSGGTCVFDITIDQQASGDRVTTDITYSADPNVSANSGCAVACTHSFQARYEQ